MSARLHTILRQPCTAAMKQGREEARQLARAIFYCAIVLFAQDRRTATMCVCVMAVENYLKDNNVSVGKLSRPHSVGVGTEQRNGGHERPTERSETTASGGRHMIPTREALRPSISHRPRGLLARVHSSVR